MSVITNLVPSSTELDRFKILFKRTLQHSPGLPSKPLQFLLLVTLCLPQPAPCLTPRHTPSPYSLTHLRFHHGLVMVPVLLFYFISYLVLQCLFSHQNTKAKESRYLGFLLTTGFLLPCIVQAHQELSIYRTNESINPISSLVSKFMKH